MAFRIVRNDITKVRADAIVNTANPEPIYSGGTDCAIYEAAGAKLLLAERARIGRLNVGQAAPTPAFALPAKYIIHTVGPSWIDGKHRELEALYSCYENSLEIARELGCESIAFPLIATGVYGFPKDLALQIAVSAISAFLLEHEMKIILVVFDAESFVLSGKVFSEIDEYIDEKTAEAKRKEEYGIQSDKSRRDGGRPAPAGRMNAAGPAPEAYAAPGSYEPLSDYDEAPVLGSAYQSMVQKPAAGDTLEERMKHIDDTWQEALLWWIDQKGYTDVEVYKRANVDRKLFSKIRSKEEYQPKKMTAVAFALALRLNLDETQDLLKRAGFALSHSNKFDLIIEYFIEHGVYDTYTINLALFDHRQPLLGE
ncbi:MAG: macro domain-containing protein [Eubacterium sp.]|nr:macro domain-containing protein [Eubacterium sp.]